MKTRHVIDIPHFDLTTHYGEVPDVVSQVTQTMPLGLKCQCLPMSWFCCDLQSRGLERACHLHHQEEGLKLITIALLEYAREGLKLPTHASD